MPVSFCIAATHTQVQGKMSTRRPLTDTYYSPLDTYNHNDIVHHGFVRCLSTTGLATASASATTDQKEMRVYVL